MTNELNRAHKDALELLKIIDDYCTCNGLIYTLSGPTLIALDKIDFDKCYPTINIVIDYEGFSKLRNHLEEFCTKDGNYSIHDYKNTKQFYDCTMWFVKKSRVKLDDSRKDEEFYYGTHISITPLYYAGDTRQEWNKVYKLFDDNILPLYFRKNVARLPLKIFVKMFLYIVRTNRYIKKRNFDNFENTIAKLESTRKTEYVFIPEVFTKFSSDNAAPAMCPKRAAGLTYSAFWSNVERINYYGVDCYCVKDREKLESLYSKEDIKEATTPIASEVVLAGGEELRRIQLIQLELLQEFDRICRKHNLKYNVNFGTLIGGFRHKGFIPWDDDIDITMYYEECDKLFEIMEKELDTDKYFYRCSETEPYHHLIFNHLERNGTAYSKAGRDKLTHKMGVFIDIFPMYPAAPNAFVDFLHTRVCRFWRTALWSTVGADSEKNKLKRLYYRQLAKMGNEKCRKNFLKHAKRFDNKDGNLKFWTSEIRSPYNVDLVKRDNFTEAIEVCFEGQYFYAPKRSIGTMEYCFTDDWSIYPILKERMPHHIANMIIGDLYSYD